MLPALSSLHLRVEGTIAWLSFDHGKANEMGSTELRDFEALAGWLEDGAVTTLISSSHRRTSKGTAIFVAGANVTERAGWPIDQVKEHVRWQRHTLARLRQAPVFHVAVVGGVALGWGTEYLLCCDYRVATSEARFGLPETGLGILPGAGGTGELAARIGMSQALRLGMTGEQIDAAEALRICLVDEVAADLAAGLARAEMLGRKVATRSPTAIAAFKAGALAAAGLDGAGRAEVEARAYEHCVDSGEAAIGRAGFGAVSAGQTPEWGPFRRWIA